MKGKIRPVVITAIARELVEFIWATMQPITLPAWYWVNRNRKPD